jgi:hypothetical protein
MGDPSRLFRWVLKRGLRSELAWLGPADPSGDAHVLAGGTLEVIQVLLQGVLVKLREKLGLGRRIELTDFVDELTFAHSRFTFR